MRFNVKFQNLSSLLLVCFQPTAVTTLIDDHEMSKKRDQIAITPRRQCLLHLGSRGDSGILGKVCSVYFSMSSHYALV